MNNILYYIWMVTIAPYQIMFRHLKGTTVTGKQYSISGEQLFIKTMLTIHLVIFILLTLVFGYF